MKKKLVLTAVLAALAVAVAPIASASADKLEGTTRVEGNAKFSPPLGLLPKASTYSFEKGKVAAEDLPEGKEAEFEGKASGTGKETTPFGAPGDWKVEEAKVENGSGLLSCLPTSVDGIADLKFEKATATIKVKYKKGKEETYTATSFFRFISKPTPGEIWAQLKSTEGLTGGNTAQGFANFLEPPSNALTKCEKEEAEILPFEAAAENPWEEAPLEAFREAATAASYAPPGAPGVGIKGTVG